MHNPLKRPEMYLEWGKTLRKVVEMLHKKEIEDFFT